MSAFLIPKDWHLDSFLGEKSSCFLEQLNSKCDQLRDLDQAYPRKLLILETDPLSYLSWLLAGHLSHFTLFLGQPHWQHREQTQVFNQLGSGWIAQNDQLYPRLSAKPEPEIPPDWILIATGGSSGSIRFAIHTWATLSASVQGFQAHLNLGSIHSFCVLPLCHVSGLMQALRALLTQGRLRLLPWKQLTEPQAWDPSHYCLSLVPTQLHRLLQIPALVPWLGQFKALLVGGGPTWPDLLDQACCHQLPLAPTYGLTETASQITTLKPEEFLSGHRSSGRPLPHGQVSILDSQGDPSGPQQTGQISVQAHSLALGYFPDQWFHGTFQPQDLGYLDQQGYLHVLGRSDQVIITGGQKVLTLEVEAALRSQPGIKDVCITGVPDLEWGQRLVALWVPEDPTLTQAMLQTRLREQLSPYKIPRTWICLSQLPRTPQGKLNRQQILQLAETHVGNSR